DRDFKKASEEHVSNLIEAGSEKVAIQHDEFRGKNSSKAASAKLDTVAQTKDLLAQRKSVAEIAKARELTEGTIIDHLEKIKVQNPAVDMKHIRDAVPTTRFKKIYTAFQK